jgi:hypothetical protein
VEETTSLDRSAAQIAVVGLHLQIQATQAIKLILKLTALTPLTSLG